MIRRVRTPEGARYYGAPIGTPIVKGRSGKLRAIKTARVVPEAFDVTAQNPDDAGWIRGWVEADLAWKGGEDWENRLASTRGWAQAKADKLAAKGKADTRYQDLVTTIDNLLATGGTSKPKNLADVLRDVLGNVEFQDMSSKQDGSLVVYNHPSGSVSLTTTRSGYRWQVTSKGKKPRSSRVFTSLDEVAESLKKELAANGAPTVHPSVTESSTDIGGNPRSLITQKKQAVAANVLPERNRKHTGWKRAGVMQGKDGRAAMGIIVDGQEEPTLYTEYDLPDDVIQGLVDDLETVRKALPSDLQDLDFGLYVPAGDPLFTDDDGNPSLDVGGYTVAGSSLITLNPLSALNQPMPAEDGWDWSDHPPFYDYESPRLSTMMHESGHLVSMQRGTLQGFGAMLVEDAMDQSDDELFGYAASAPQEAYAELYAQYKIGGRGSLDVADRWADQFAWD